jgi:thioredoxin-related protein
MKKHTILLIFTFSMILLHSHSSIAQDAKKPATKEVKIKWYSFEEAYNLNKKKPKKIFIDVFTDWCGWCKKMDAETFANPYIAKYMNNHFYCVKLDAERKDTVIIDGVKFVNPNPSVKRSTHQLANEMLRNQMSYPSYVFLNEKGQSVFILPGFRQAKEFEAFISFFGEDAYLNTNLNEYIAKFQGELK